MVRLQLPAFGVVLLAGAMANDGWASRKMDYVDVASTEGLSKSMHGQADDSVLYFYAPWCTNCAQFDRIWTNIAEVRAATNGPRASMSKFNCEQTPEHTRLCTEAGVDQYPAVIYFGSERVNGRNAVKYPGDLYGEAIRDWISMLEGVTWWRRLLKKLGSVVGSILPSFGRKRGGGKYAGASSYSPPDEHIGATGEAYFGAGSTPTDVEQFESEDAFLAMDEVSPVYQLALQTCVADMTLEFCRELGETVEEQAAKQPYCGIVEDCYTKGFYSLECSPSTGCPLGDEGCAMVNLCVQPDVLGQYQDLLRSEGLV
eukprot:CAMPEP_0118885940 /NCGR_PEP_ID=MMETSP1163-20130328/24202_1 /TAXON_ID=124430 /ORGANISM="Phaeomonas parva, Strain CCMP2877" /LENGTH=313 /DNA_ID=CAMNT_0006824037 /DNA_START=7 /DNA_END=948 /DNA_ORIENTATION=+